MPYPFSKERFLEATKKCDVNKLPDSIFSRMWKIAEGTGVKTRHDTHPHWLPTNKTPDDYPDAKKLALPKELFTLNNYNFECYERMAVHDNTCVKLAIEASKKL